MLNIVLTIGIPASGKSTWAKKHVEENPGWIRINNDDLRSMLHNNVLSNENEHFIRSVRSNLIQNAILKDKSVIIDNTNFDKERFNEIVELARHSNKDVTVSEKAFYIDLESALLRDAKREDPVGKEVISKFWDKSNRNNFKNYQCREVVVSATDKPCQNVVNPHLPNAIVCDLDGTLQTNHGRSFYDATTCDQDHPNYSVIETVKMCYKSGYKIVFMSGREEQYKEPTEKFFKQHLPEVSYELFMRATGDQRKDSKVKLELYQNHIQGKYNVLFWLDDRDQVVEMVRKQGITCFQVAYGNF